LDFPILAGDRVWAESESSFLKRPFCSSVPSTKKIRKIWHRGKKKLDQTILASGDVWNRTLITKVENQTCCCQNIQSGKIQKCVNRSFIDQPVTRFQQYEINQNHDWKPRQTNLARKPPIFKMATKDIKNYVTISMALLYKESIYIKNILILEAWKSHPS
jgi:hypothetical protein